MVGNNGNTTPSMASTTANHPKIISNQRAMPAPATIIAAYCTIGKQRHASNDAQRACFCGGSQAS
ncbi:hypothetical protein GCM10023078_47300 [Gibbsiella greigii]